MPIPFKSTLRGNAPSPTAAFTLLEVLSALALCVLLASVTATAVIHSGASARRAVRLQDQALRLSSLYVQTRLHPDTLAATAAFPVASPWRLDLDERIEPAPPPPPVSLDRPPLPPPPPRRWTLLNLRDAAGELRPVQLAILEPPTP